MSQEQSDRGEGFQSKEWLRLLDVDWPSLSPIKYKFLEDKKLPHSAWHIQYHLKQDFVHVRVSCQSDLCIMHSVSNAGNWSTFALPMLLHTNLQDILPEIHGRQAAPVIPLISLSLSIHLLFDGKEISHLHWRKFTQPKSRQYIDAWIKWLEN